MHSFFFSVVFIFRLFSRLAKPLRVCLYGLWVWAFSGVKGIYRRQHGAGHWGRVSFIVTIIPTGRTGRRRKGPRGPSQLRFKSNKKLQINQYNISKMLSFHVCDVTEMQDTYPLPREQGTSLWFRPNPGVSPCVRRTVTARDGAIAGAPHPSQFDVSPFTCKASSAFQDLQSIHPIFRLCVSYLTMKEEEEKNTR